MSSVGRKKDAWAAVVRPGSKRRPANFARELGASGADDEKVELGSGNVFADLGFRDPEERLLKAKLATQIVQLIEEKRWTQTETAERIGLDQPKYRISYVAGVPGFSGPPIRYSESPRSRNLADSWQTPPEI